MTGSKAPIFPCGFSKNSEWEGHQDDWPLALGSAVLTENLPEGPGAMV